MCKGNASPATLRHYDWLEASLDEERNLLRDWSANE